MVAIDRSIEHQQSLTQYDSVVGLLIGPSNRLEDTIGLVPKVERLLDEGVKPGRLYRCSLTYQRVSSNWSKPTPLRAAA